ncbi:MAG: hypothetical protein A2V66_08660 [Ignavibacteria bacterium RBG_13_36_8]|nr:MAG: hypothetical protein A2V66_08660 [Ignavibacteria bacterium RBG_13_36_8]
MQSIKIFTLNLSLYFRRAFSFNKFFILLFFIFNISNIIGQEENKRAYPEVNIPGTHVREIYSSIVDQEYKLYINLPRYYDDPNRTFPVVYLLDAQWDFSLVSAIYGQQYYDGFLPELIIVGITWGGSNPNADYLRARDFTPTNIKQLANSGNAPKFFEFIKEELIPFIESNYKASRTDRTLMGSSFGGLFTLYTFLNHTGLFNRYVLTSPALGWDNGIIYKYENNYAEKNKDLPAKLYMAVGGLESNLPDFEKFAQQLQNRNYNEFEMGTRILEGIGHSGSKAEGFTRGLQFVFSKPSLNLDDNILQQYTGTYELSSKIRINIVVENNNLYVLLPDNSKIILQAETESDFYVNGEYSNAHFQKDDSGKVTGFKLQRYNREEFVTKITDDKK